MSSAALRRVTLSVVIGLVVGVLAAVVLDRRGEADARPSGAAGPGRSTHGPATGSDCPAGAPSRDDLAYVRSMRAHHQQAVEMADLLRDRPGVAFRVLNFAEQVAVVQDSEIADMDAWLTAWEDELDGTECLGGNDHEGHAGTSASHHRMPGMLTPAQLDQLGRLDGPQAGRRYVSLMIEHHLGAVAMSRPVARDGVNAWAVSLAKHVVASQASEIGAMRRMRDDA